MYKMKSTLLSVLCILLLLLHLFGLSEGGNVAVYWGQNGVEGNLIDTCATGNFAIVNLAFLNVFGNGQTPELNLAGHCDPDSGGCTGLSDDIIACQQTYGVKILLSIGGATGSYGLSSIEDAQQVANYLWDDFLGGGSDSRPLGPAVLDGIDFDIEAGSSSHYDDLAEFLTGFGTKVYLSADPQCPYPDAYLGAALDTGRFDYVWVQFYNNDPCDYEGDATNLLYAWNTWTSSIQTGVVYMGLPASQAAAGSGFIPVDVLLNSVLPSVQGSSRYGGVMLWDRYNDEQSGYSDSIKGSV